MKNRNTGLWIEGGNNRRQFLKLAGFGTLGLASGGLWPLLNFSTAGQNQETIPATEFRPDLDISLTARPGEVSIFPGAPTRVWQDHALVHEGDNNRVIEVPRAILARS